MEPNFIHWILFFSYFQTAGRFHECLPMQQTNTVLMLSQGTTDNLWHQFVSLPKGLPCSIWPMVVRTQSHPQEAQNRKPKCDFRGFLESSGIFSLPLFWVGFSFWGFWESLCESAMIFHFFLTEHRHALTPQKKKLTQDMKRKNVQRTPKIP